MFPALFLAERLAILRFFVGFLCCNQIIGYYVCFNIVKIASYQILTIFQLHYSLDAIILAPQVERREKERKEESKTER
jgi:hypothetical protein